MPYLSENERLDQVNEQLSLIQKKDGLTFGTDAFLLAAFMRPCRKGLAVELGTGTGIISLLSAARDRFAKIWALEIQEEFATLAARNVLLNRMERRIFVRHADLREFSVSEIDKEVDVVFSNPPYMRTDSGARNRSDKKYIARHEVCGEIGDFCAAAARLLKYGGKFYCVWRPDRLSELIVALHLQKLEPKTMIFVHADAESDPSMVLVSAIKGGAPSLRVLPPLFLHDTVEKNGMRVLSRRAQKIYDTMSFDENGES